MKKKVTITLITICAIYCITLCLTNVFHVAALENYWNAIASQSKLARFYDVGLLSTGAIAFYELFESLRKNNSNE